MIDPQKRQFRQLPSLPNGKAGKPGKAAKPSVHQLPADGNELVHRLTEAIFAYRKVPYYATLASNLSSRNVASRVGFAPCWISLLQPTDVGLVIGPGTASTARP